MHPNREMQASAPAVYPPVGLLPRRNGRGRMCGTTPRQDLVAIQQRDGAPAGHILYSIHPESFDQKLRSD